MCCLFTVLVFLGPRFGILFWWLLEPARFEATFGDKWLLQLLTFIFLPWCFLMYLCVAPYGAVTAGPDITGFDWVWMGLAFLVDIASYAGGGWGNRKAVPASIYSGSPSADYPYTPPPSSTSGTSSSGTTST